MSARWPRPPSPGAGCEALKTWPPNEWPPSPRFCRKKASETVVVNGGFTAHVCEHCAERLEKLGHISRQTK